MMTQVRHRIPVNLISLPTLGPVTIDTQQNESANHKLQITH